VTLHQYITHLVREVTLHRYITHVLRGDYTRHVRGDCILHQWTLHENAERRPSD